MTRRDDLVAAQVRPYLSYGRGSLRTVLGDSNDRAQSRKDCLMPLEIQLTAGFITGLVAGLALGLLRPLMVLALAAAAVYLAGMLLTQGVPGVTNVFSRAGHEIVTYAPFFGALGLGNATAGIGTGK